MVSKLHFPLLSLVLSFTTTSFLISPPPPELFCMTTIHRFLPRWLLFWLLPFWKPASNNSIIKNWWIIHVLLIDSCTILGLNLAYWNSFLSKKHKSSKGFWTHNSKKNLSQGGVKWGEEKCHGDGWVDGHTAKEPNSMEIQNALASVNCSPLQQLSNCKVFKLSWHPHCVTLKKTLKMIRQTLFHQQQQHGEQTSVNPVQQLHQECFLATWVENAELLSGLNPFHLWGHWCHSPSCCNKPCWHNHHYYYCECKCVRSGKEDCFFDSVKKTGNQQFG